MPEPYKVEVRDPPQGVPPPHQRETSKKSHGDHINRLRKFIAKPSAGLRIRIHPTLQSEQIGVVPVEGTINIVDEFHNSDGVWVRLGQESLLEFCAVNYTEGWCLQYNQHLEKTLLVPVAAEPKQVKATAAAATGGAGATAMPNPFLNNTEPLLKPATNAESKDWKPVKRPKGPGIYTVVKCGASGHNIRSNPNLMAPPIGMLALGDQVSVLRTKEINGEVWVQLETETAEKHCFQADNGDAWSLAYSDTDILYLEAVLRPSEEARGRTMSRPITVIPPPSSQIQKPIPPPRMHPDQQQLLQQPQQPPTASPRRDSINRAARTPSPKPSFFQKWFKGEAIKRPGSQSPTRSKVASTIAGAAASAAANKDIPPELIGVSVKELVKVIGESRANGNGVTPPGTPGTPRKSRSPASPQVSSRGSSPSSVRLTAAGAAAVPRCSSKSPLSHDITRQDSNSDSTSNLVSSLTRDQSPHESSPSLSMRSDVPARSSESPSTTSIATSKLTTEVEEAPQQQPVASSVKKVKKKSPRIRGRSSEKHRGAQQQQPVKEALSPSVAESIRAVFAAFVWHEGIVHDTMAVASYLKFHPTLSKHGQESMPTASSAASEPGPVPEGKNN